MKDEVVEAIECGLVGIAGRRAMNSVGGMMAINAINSIGCMTIRYRAGPRESCFALVVGFVACVDSLV